MKFHEMPYARPDLEQVKGQLAGLTRRLKEAAGYDQAKAVFLEKEQAQRHLYTAQTLAHIRHSIDTRDAFYDGEMKFWNAAMPELQEYEQAWTMAMLASPYRADFAAEYGDLMFVNAEIALKTFSPEIIPQLQQENDLTQEYEKLLASAQIPFEGKVYTLSQLTPFKNDPDDARRLAAWKAEGQWYKDNQEKLDAIYDQLVHLRDEMGKKLGYEGYTTLGYYRKGRNCYTKEDVSASAPRGEVPGARGRPGLPQAGPAPGQGIPHELCRQRPGVPLRQPKARGPPPTTSWPRGRSSMTSSPRRPACSSAPCWTMSCWTCSPPRASSPAATAPASTTTACPSSSPTSTAPSTTWRWSPMRRATPSPPGPTGTGCPWSTSGPPWRPARSTPCPWSSSPSPGRTASSGRTPRSSCTATCPAPLTFIPYGTMVDHFQHEVYANPDMTPAQRHAVWKELLGVYMPWMRLDGDIPFYSEGEGWQRQHHIYSSPLLLY